MMFRIDDPTAVSAAPSDIAPTGSTPGFFTNGNPASGQAATLVEDWWLNQIQEENMSILAAGGITPQKGTNNQVLAAITALFGSGRLINIQRITSSGTYVPTPGANSAECEAVGGGGAGGGAYNSTQGPGTAAGSGGAYGAYRKWRMTNIAGQTFPVTIGAGGTPVNDASGNTGGTTSMTTASGTPIVNLPGGSGGLVGVSTAQNTCFAASQSDGGVGTITTSSTVEDIDGLPGPNGSCGLSLLTQSVPGIGASGVLGTGGGNDNSGNGVDASGYGAGGGGGGSQGGPATAGGRGSQGIIIVREYT